MESRIALHHSSRRFDSDQSWVNTIKQRRGYNVATVALANKNARVLWALLARRIIFRDIRQLLTQPPLGG